MNGDYNIEKDILTICENKMKDLETIIEIVNQISGIDIKEQKRESHYVY